MTKKIIFLSIVLIIVGLLIFGYIFFATKSKAFVADFIKKGITENVSIGYIGIEYPLRIALRDVKIFQRESTEKKDIVKIDRVYIYPHPVLSFKNRILISKVDIIHPVIAVTRGTDGSFNISIPNGMLKAQQSRNLFISRIDLEDGRLQYLDKKLNNGFNLDLENIDARFDSISFPFGQGTSRFRLFADIKGRQSHPATLSLNGYIKMQDKSLKAKLSIEDFNVNTLESLYKRYLGGFVKEGVLNCYSRLDLQNQTLKADCRLNIERASFVKDINISPADNMVAEFSLTMNLKDNTIKINNVKGNLFEVLFDKVLTAQKNNTTSQITN